MSSTMVTRNDMAMGQFIVTSLQRTQNYLLGSRSSYPDLNSNKQRMFSTSDTAMMKQVQATHAPDGSEVDVKPIIQITEKILIQAIAGTIDGDHGKQEQVDAMEKAAALDEFDMIDTLPFVIHKISCELSCKCSGGGDAHATTMVLLKEVLYSYPWHAKVVLTVAAFAINGGKFWLVAQLCASNTLAKSVALLEQLPDLAENGSNLRPQFDATNKLVKATLDVTKCIVEFKELPSKYISEDTTMSVASAYIPLAAYWTIRSIVACSTQISSLVGLRNEYIQSTTDRWELSTTDRWELSTTDPWELQRSIYKINSIYENLKKELARCYLYIDDKRCTEASENLVRLFDMVHADKMKILKALIYAKDDIQPLIKCATKKKASLEILRRKHVLLLISDLDISAEEIVVLDKLYKTRRHEMHYEIVWIPIVDRLTRNQSRQVKFEQLLAIMPWFSVQHPLMIEQAVMKSIKEVWNFAKRPIVVALDPQGKLSSSNAHHMMWIWGNSAFPFSREKEESLWKQEIWSLELLIDGIDPTVLEWIAEGRFICIYGGEDQQWIKTFTSAAMAAAQAGNFSLEMVYVGKSNAKERMQKMIDTFAKEKYSYYWPAVTSIWFFWARLESVLYSKLQQGRNVENDQIMREVMTTLSYDGSDQGWAIFCRGAAEMARAKGDMAVRSMQDIDKWKGNIERDGLVPAIRDYLEKLQTPHHCNRLILPGNTGGIPEIVVCTECGRPMEKFIMYRCCVE